MKIAALLLTSALLSGCATEPVIHTQTVEVPVTVYCKVKDVPKPALPFDEQASVDMSLRDKVKLLAAQDEVLKGYATELEGSLVGCKAPDDNQTK